MFAIKVYVLNNIHYKHKILLMMIKKLTVIIPTLVYSVFCVPVTVSKYSHLVFQFYFNETV